MEQAARFMSATAPPWELGADFLNIQADCEIPLCPDDSNTTHRIYLNTEQAGDVSSFFALTATSVGVGKIYNKFLPRHLTLLKAAQCSVHEALKSSNVRKLNYSKIELISKSPTFFSFLHPRDKLYGLQLDNLGDFAVIKNQTSIIHLSNHNLSEGLRIARECCRIATPLSNAVDLNGTLPFLPTKQSVKRMIHSICL